MFYEFLMIVDRDTGNIYPIYPPFPCSESLIPSVGGGGGVKKTNVFYRKTIFSHFVFSSHFMLFPTFLENKFLVIPCHTKYIYIGTKISLCL